MPDLVLKDGCYRTAEGSAGRFARLFPSFSFYARFLLIVRRCASMAKRGVYDSEAWRSSSVDVMRALEKAGCQIEVEGADNLRDAGGACLIIGNHMSMMETVLLPAIVVPYNDATFVVKQSLVDYPVFKHVMRSRDPITVTRDNPRADLKAMLTGGSQKLASGVSLIVFPQTSRTAGFDPEQFNSIGTMLARRAEATIVPLAVKTDAWCNGSWLKDFGRIDPSRKVHFAFGKPMRVSDRGDEEHLAIIEFITTQLRRWQ